jgi:muconolactone delta-isomerase
VSWFVYQSKEIQMLFLSKIRIDAPDLTIDEFWNVWADGSEIAERSGGHGGVVKAIYKVAGQRKVVVINDVSNHDDLDRIMMTAHLSQRMTIEDMLPLREYGSFASDLRSRWSTVPEGVYVPE